MGILDSEAREQTQRIIESEFFRSSELQRRLLKYLAEKSLSGGADQLKEYTIGVEALGKPESYDPRRDSSVRLQSSKLRHKILEYYLTKGQSDPVLIDIPRGHFKLVFNRREPRSALVLNRTSSMWRRTALASWVVFTLALMGLCAYLGTALVRQEQRATVTAEVWPPTMEEFWSPFLNHKDLTVICVGAPLFVRLPGVGFLLRDSEVNSWHAAVSSGMIGRLKRLFPGETPEPWHNFTGVGEAGGALLIGSMLATGGVHLHFADSNQLTWNEIGEHNVVFVGPSKFIAQIEELPVVRDLIIESSGVRNLRPQPGEPAFLPDEYTDAQHQNGHTHALISRLPGLHGKGEILVLGGTWTEGTLAASEYLTLGTHVRELLTRIRLPSGKLPPYFQAVISATIKGSTPVEVSYLFHHVLTATGRAPRLSSTGPDPP